VAWKAKRESIVGIKPEFRMRPPRLDMMHFEATAVLPATLTRPVVTFEDRSPEGAIGGGLACRLSDGCVAPLPQGMLRTTARIGMVGATVGDSDARLDFSSVLWTEVPAPKGRSDPLALVIRDGPSLCGRFADAGGTNLRSRFGGLGWVVGEVLPSHPTGLRTEPLALPVVGAIALVTDATVTLRHLKGDCSTSARP
jgi:hypothetical protein